MKFLIPILVSLSFSSCADRAKYSLNADRVFPTISEAPQFEQMEVSSSILEEFELAPEEVASRLWDFANTCKDCSYKLPYVNDVQVFNSSASELYVWQHIKKGIWVFSINSYSFLKANQYRSQAGDKIIIDTVTPDENMIESLSLEYGLEHDASFESIHVRMIISETELGSELEIKVTAVPRGLQQRLQEGS